MHFQSLFSRPADCPVRACLMGAGEFGASFVSQAQLTPNMDVPAICTRTVSRAAGVYAGAGVPESRIRVCDTAEDAAKAAAEGLFVVVDSFAKLSGVPLEVLVESSGAPESSAVAAEQAILRGMHVVMVSKETDSVVGPILARKARARGVVYTTGEGDQPSMLIGLVSWARALGMNIAGAGKSGEYDFVYDPAAGRLDCEGQRQSFDCPELSGEWLLGGRKVADVVAARAKILGRLHMRTVADMCEMTVVANATGLKPDRPTFHAPVARMQEMPDMFCPAADGGLFARPGGLDIFSCLRRPDEVSMAGGEFIVVECGPDKKSWDVIAAKGHPISRNGKYAALYLPRHLLGVETGTSVLAAATMGHATGGDNLRPVCDVHARANRDLKKGDVLEMAGHNHAIDCVDAFMSDAAPIADDGPLPFYLFSNRTLARDVPAGKRITAADVAAPEGSVMFRLRREQDKAFA